MTDNCFCDLPIGQFVVRGDCGGWHPVYLWMYQNAHLLITAAYIALPSVMLFAYLTERDGTGKPINALPARDRNQLRAVFSAFILFCGVGHLEGYLSFYWPSYHLFAVWHMATALVSWIAVIETVRHRASLIVGV